MELRATTQAGFEELLANEIIGIGGKVIKTETRSVLFTGDKRVLYRANYELRTAIRILFPIHHFRVRHESGLYSKIKQIDWSNYFGLKSTFAITATTHSKYFRHSKYAALKSKDAIVDQFRDKFGRRPNVDIKRPSIRINIHIHDDKCTVSLDSSSESLHLRGYRQEVGEAPLNEVTAAGMILLSNWNKEKPFVDPMCGSGTLLVEAARIAGNIPPQINRNRFGFFFWKDFDQDLWNEVVENAKSKIVPINVPIMGFDKDFKVLRMAERNIELAGLSEVIQIERKKIENLELGMEEGIVITNPPYDVRLVNDDINAFYKLMGDRFKHHFKGFTVWLISSNFQAFKNVGLRPSAKIPIYNGPLECRFVRYEMF